MSKDAAIALDIHPLMLSRWRNRPPSARALKDALLLQQIKAVFNARAWLESLRAIALKTYSKPAKVKFFYKEIQNKRKEMDKR
ncbi:hypothetical protein GCM10027050_10480 [Psychrosphaera aestuarii]